MFVLGCTLFVKNIKKNICEIILIAFVIICISGLSAMYYYERSKLDVTAKLEGENIYFFENSNFEDMVFHGTTGKLNGVSDELTVKSINTSYEYRLNNKKAYEIATLLGYDSRIYERFKPLLEQGIWLDKVVEHDEYIPVVITKEISGIDIGDVIRLDGLECEFKIYGIIQDGAEIFWNGNSYSILNDNYNGLYEAAYYELNNGFYIIARNEDLVDKVTLNASIKTFVAFDGVSEKEKSDNISYMSQNGHYSSLEDFNKKSRELLWNMIWSFAPTVIFVITIIAFSFVLMTMITYRENTKYLSVYYLVGMTWRDYIKITLVERCITFLSGIFVAVAIHAWLYNRMGNTIYLMFDIKELLWCTSISLILFSLQSLVSTVMFFRFSPKESLKAKGEMVW